MNATVKRKFCLPYLLTGGFLTGLTLVFPQIGFLEWVTMIPLFIGVYRLCGSGRYGAGKTFWFGFLTVYLFYFVNYHWFFYLHPLESVGMDPLSSLFLVLAGWLGLPLLQAIPGGLIFLIFRAMHRTMLFRRAPLLRPFVFSALWVVFEWSSTLHWSGVPWGRLCIGQSAYLPMLQSASLFGSYFISFLLLLVNGLLAYAILYRRRPLRSTVCAVTASLLVAANLLCGMILLQPKAKAEDSVRVAVLQGNIDSHQKWDYSRLVETQNVFGEMTLQAAREGAELVIFPETTFPYALNQNPSICNFLSSLAYQCDVTILVGALYLSPSGEKYNALYCVEPNGNISEQMYFKRHLVPFGEYIPMKQLIMTLIPPLGEFCITMDNNLTAGKDAALIETAHGSIGGLICFDSIYEQLALDSVKAGAEFLVVSSNDSWFYDSAAMYQHEAQAQLRAIETGRYLLRSGTTGISAVITDRGEHLVRIDPLKKGYAVADAVPNTSQTLYTQIGNLFVYLCIAFVALLWIIGFVLQKRRPIRI